MDLTPIIYSSMLVVFSLLGIVILASFICSKLSFCGSKKNKQVKKECRTFVSEMELPSMHKNLSKNVVKSEQLNFEIPIVEGKSISFSIPEVDEEIIIDSFVNYNSEPELLRQEIMQNEHQNSLSRYSVINSYSRNESFSKMSVQYS